jgi:disulfide bond formation protein DsbB
MTTIDFQVTRPAAAETGSDDWCPPRTSQFREAATALGLALAIMAPMLAVGGWSIRADWMAREAERLAAIEAAQAYERLVAAPAGPAVPLEEAVHGRQVFMMVCAACHGQDAKGMEGLGKNLVESDFVAAQSDEDLRKFIIAGRPDAKPIPMPPRAGRDDLTDQDLSHVVAYVRGLQDPRRMPDLPPMTAVAAAAPSEAQKAAALAAAGGDAELAEYIAHGDSLFHSTCVACHGKGGVGIPGNGKPLVKNAFIASLDDDGLLAFIKQGRGPTDPKNTTGIQMPPKGGNPAMSEDDILDVIAYLRTLQETRPKTASNQQ